MGVATGRADDELAIRTVLARLAHCADAGDVDGYLALLAPDIEWVMPDNPAIGLAGSVRRGHDEVAAGQRDRIAAGHQGPGSATLHWVGVVAVTFAASVPADAPDEASAESCFQFFTSTTTTPTLTTVGRYHDRFVGRPADGADGVGGQWLLAHRTIVIG